MLLLQQCFADSKCLQKYEMVELLVPQQFDISKILLQLAKAKTQVYSIRLLISNGIPLSLSKLISSVDSDLAFFNICKLSAEISSLQNSIVYIPIVNDLPYRALNNSELQETLGHLSERLVLNSETHILIENNDTLWEQLESLPFNDNSHIRCNKSLNLSYYPLEQISGALTLSVMCSDFSGTVYLPSNYLDTFQNIDLVGESDITTILLTKTAYRRKEYFNELIR